MLNFTVITIFPQMLDSALGHSILKRPRKKVLISFEPSTCATTPPTATMSPMIIPTAAARAW